METIEAKILLKNLLKRIRKLDDDAYELSGTLTDDEMTALRMAAKALDGAAMHIPETRQSAAQSPVLPADQGPLTPSLRPIAEFVPNQVQEDIPKAGFVEEPAPAPLKRKVEIDTSALALAPAPDDRRLCFDFGTAMSKVTLVRDYNEERGFEDIEVLKLGVPGDQEELSETMLISSVYIDNEGKLWFGNMAMKYSHIEAISGDRQRIDNIKRFLSEEGLDSVVAKVFNPTDINITYGDMVLAYLMFLTWAVNSCIETDGEPRNLNRRFAMPCFEQTKSNETARILRRILGEAQVLADTFFSTLKDGIPLKDFVSALQELRSEKRDYGFVKEGLTEPLGVAGSMISWEKRVNALVMVVDVGAGTSDFSMYLMSFNENTGKSAAYEVANSSEGITEAGNHLDKLLKGLILKEAGVDSSHPHWINIQGNLELDLRDYKERLFKDGEVTVRLFNDALVSVELEKFLSLDQVKQFGESLKNCRDEILNRIDSSFVTSAPNGTLAVALTGGGASLPMVTALAQGVVEAQGKELKLVQTKGFPEWLEENFDDLEDVYPRIAVSLGGARKRIISDEGVASITAGGMQSSPSLDGYYTKG